MKRWSWKALVLALVLAAVPAAAVPARAAETEAAAEADHWDGNSYIRGGKKVTGLVKIGKKQYFFSKKGVLVKNRVAYKITVKKKVGYYNIDAKGVATKWTGAAEMAAAQLYSLKAIPSSGSMTAAKKSAALKKAFLWSAKLEFVNRPDKKLSAAKALEYYGKLGFAQKKGDCITQAATFVLMAKVMGYDASLMRGYVPTAKGFSSHAWAQIKIGKKTYVFDPNFNTSADAKGAGKPTYGDKKTKGYYFQYGDKGTYTYHNAKKKLIK